MPNDEQNFKELLKHILDEFKKPLNTDYDFKLLEKDIEKKTTRISAQTLKRLFGKVKTDFKRSQKTLDFLAQYCGFKDYKNFEDKLIENEFITLFKKVTPELDAPKDQAYFWRRTEELCEKIIEKPEYLTRTHHDLMELPRARLYLMEQHPMRDLISTVYGQYFTEYLKYAITDQSKIFAYTFLYMGHL